MVEANKIQPRVVWDGPQSHTAIHTRCVHHFTDCPLCFGTDITYPYNYRAASCPNCAPKAGASGGASHRQVLIGYPMGPVAWVDAGIADFIEGLWEVGIDTSASCQGDSVHKSAYVDLMSPTDDQVLLARELIRNVGIITAERPRVHVERQWRASEYMEEHTRQHLFEWRWRQPVAPLLANQRRYIV